MSKTPFFFVERYDSTLEAYDLQHPLIWNYDHTERIPADLFPYNACYKLFSIVEERSDFPKMKGIHQNIPIDSCKEIKESYESSSSLSTSRWFTYADMYIYLLENPKVKDYDEYGDEVVVDNPVFALKERIDAFLNVMDWWDWKDDYSLIRIIYWIED